MGDGGRQMRDIVKVCLNLSGCLPTCLGDSWETGSFQLMCFKFVAACLVGDKWETGCIAVTVLLVGAWDESSLPNNPFIH